jgi:Fe-S-cluster-containing hydrogenase component 2/CRP-like cAMP-binding protein
MAENPFLDEIAVSWEEEGLFSRDLDGQLIRLEKATERDYATVVEIELDGQVVQIAKSVPSTDSQGNVLIDEEGRTIPRRSTIYDAAYKLYGEALRREQIIPTLCHVDHLHPVGVCRVCSVEVAKREKDRNDPTKTREVVGEKLLPACVQPVEPGMIVHTRRSPASERGRKRVETSLRVLVELLSADHLPAAATPGAQDTDFGRLVQRLSSEKLNDKVLDPTRFRTGSQPPREKDNSSHFIAVDHSACILCDRCSRSCNDIKGNFVIGRSGKGYSTHIGFDLNDPMGLSSCVECGECMLSCPTTALTFREPIESQWYRDEVQQPGRKGVSLADLRRVPLLDGISDRWLEWNKTSIIRWDVKPGDTICRLGEYGATAFIVESGKYEVLVPIKQAAYSEPAQAAAGNWFTRLFGGSATPAASALELHRVDEMQAEDVLFGEMSCLSSYPRNATVRATAAGTLYVIRRNVLYNLQRNPAARKILNRVYLERAVFDQVRRINLFDDLTPQERKDCEQILLKEAKLVTLDPGQPVFRQGERPDAFYMVRIGHVKLVETFAGQERILTYLGPNKLFGEVAFTLELPEFANDANVPEQLRGRRTASALALDDVELVRVAPETFRKLLDQFPALRNRFLASARTAIGNLEKQRNTISRTALNAFTEQGLFNAQKLLVIDLESCTRCDECTKACSDTHDGITRLIRDGKRFDKFLVASSCRSCTDPYCLVGCPVDAIHRDGERLEIRIEKHCIGCGLCANNCPYGNINMVDTGTKWIEDPGAANKKVAAVQHQATTCDLCTNVVGAGQEVSCVYACPHHAAFRVSGTQLFDWVEAERAGTS